MMDAGITTRVCEKVRFHFFDHYGKFRVALICNECGWNFVVEAVYALDDERSTTLRAIRTANGHFAKSILANHKGQWEVRP